MNKYTIWISENGRSCNVSNNNQLYKNILMVLEYCDFIADSPILNFITIDKIDYKHKHNIIVIKIKDRYSINDFINELVKFLICTDYKNDCKFDYNSLYDIWDKFYINISQITFYYNVIYKSLVNLYITDAINDEILNYKLFNLNQTYIIFLNKFYGVKNNEKNQI